MAVISITVDASRLLNNLGQSSISVNPEKYILLKRNLKSWPLEKHYSKGRFHGNVVVLIEKQRKYAFVLN